MNKIILFSPVGGTDPISESNMRDGSLLHICRYYQPTDVYLYMSKEIVRLHKQDNRYLYCLEQLDVLQERHTKCHLIKRETLKNVQEFDFFYDEFRGIIQKIFDSMDSSDKLLINISSGTPAMKSGLLVWATISEQPYTLIQVTTPDKAMNEHVHRDFEPKLFWELNEDNSDPVNRCKEVTCPSLSVIKNEEIIKKHVLAYDYSAALRVAKSLPKERTKKYIHLLEMADARLLMDCLNTA